MNYCYTCKEWSIRIGDCPKCGNVRIYFYPAKGHYERMLKENQDE